VGHEPRALEAAMVSDVAQVHPILAEDLEYIWNALSGAEREFFNGRTLLITGCAGFLGYSFLHFFARYGGALGIRRTIGLDNFLLGRADWLARLQSVASGIELHAADVRNMDMNAIPGASEADVIIHMASIASPTFYRKYPIETLEANVWGLRALLDYYKERQPAGLLFFSSSEVYGDPAPEFVPTPETYRGNVACIGPRACYDEAKRCGETFCYLYAERFGMPITIVRPFNNYGPGMRLDDRRVPADFAAAVLARRDIEIFSDGTPTRTFCYVADAIVGYLKALALRRFDYFNIGIDRPEISVRALAEIYREAGSEMCGYKGQIRLAAQPESAYLTDNPNRRCPNMDKARSVLGFDPQIHVAQGVRRFVSFVTGMGGGL
jgi:UDP-glucuronate decarboxylase